MVANVPKAVEFNAADIKEWKEKSKVKDVQELKMESSSKRAPRK